MLCIIEYEHKSKLSSCIVFYDHYCTARACVREIDELVTVHDINPSAVIFLEAFDITLVVWKEEGFPVIRFITQQLAHVELDQRFLCRKH